MVRLDFLVDARYETIFVEPQRAERRRYSRACPRAAAAVRRSPRRRRPQGEGRRVQTVPPRRPTPPAAGGSAAPREVAQEPRHRAAAAPRGRRPWCGQGGGSLGSISSL